MNTCTAMQKGNHHATMVKVLYFLSERGSAMWRLLGAYGSDFVA
jgi:hypothetical protein